MNPGRPVVGIAAALPNEARCLGIKNRVSGVSQPYGAASWVHTGGTGADNARAAAQTLIKHGATALVSWGFAGALDATLAAGALVLPSRIIDDRGRCYTVNDSWANGLGRVLSARSDCMLTMTTGALLTYPHTITSRAEKQALWRRHQAVAVDMESSAVAAVAKAAGLPFVAIRSISDTADTSLPSTALAMIGTGGQLQPLHGLLHWLGHLQQTPAMLRLALGSRQASHSLSIIATLAGPQLLAPPRWAEQARECA